MAKLFCHFTSEGKSCHSCEFYVANMSFSAIRENKILAKIPNLQYDNTKQMSVHPAKHIPAWASTQSDQRFQCALSG